MAYVIASELLKSLLAGTKKHPNYKKAVEKSDEMLLLTEGKGIDGNLDAYRPTEPPHVKQYKKANLKLITKSPIGKIIKCLSKIGRADDFKISYPKMGGVLEGEDLETYCEKNFPHFDSFVNWYFTSGNKGMLTEPNGWICWLPTAYGWDTQSYPKPYPKFFRAEQVLDWSEGEYIFVLLDEKAEIKDSDGKVVGAGNIYLLVTDIEVVSYKDTGNRDTDNGAITYKATLLSTHGFDELPAYRFGGEVVSASDPTFCESFIAPVAPYFSLALIEQSDKQVSVKEHAYPESEEFALGKCEKCEGKGQYYQHGTLTNGELPKVNCEVCKGTGNVYSPAGHRIRREPLRNEFEYPFPSKAYISKDLGPLAFMDKDIDGYIRNGFSSLGMDFLYESPLAQSGVAKQYDREELNGFLHQVARHVMENILKPGYWYIIRWRYPLLSREQMEAIMPILTVPEHFDIASLAAMEAEIAAATAAGVDARVVAPLNIKYAEKRFRNDPMTVTLIRLAMELDPLAGKSEDDKMTVLSNKGITEDEYILSANVETLLRLAIEEDDKFPEKDFKAQRDILLKAAAELKAEIAKQATPLIPVPPIPVPPLPNPLPPAA